MKKIILITILSAVLNTVLFGQNIYTVTKETDPNPFDHPYNYNDALCDTAMYGTLQWAIRKTNDATPPSEIRFNIPGTGQHIINLNFSFPAINKQVKIDGSTQPGYSYNNGPSIIIDGTNIPIYNCCFNFSSGCDNSIVKGTHIQNFWASTGVSVWSGNVSISDCMFWNVGGQVWPWRNMGVYIAAPNAVVQGNIFGTDVTGIQNHACSAEAIYIQSQWLLADNCIIGGNGQNEGNIIANSGWSGIAIDNAKYNKISRNKIYDNNGAINLILWVGAPNWGNEGKTAPIIDTLTPSGVLYGTAQSNDIIEIFGSTGSQNANEYLQTVVADASGNWNATMSNFNWPYFIATATDAANNTSELSNAYEIIIPPPMASCATATEITIDSICIPQNFLGQTTDIWFKFIPDTANVYINVSYPATAAATIDRMNVYEGDCDSLILYAQINNDTLSLYDLIPGNIYYLKLRAAQTGYFNICGQKGEPIYLPPDYEIEPPAGNGAYYVNRGQIIDTYNNLRPDIKYYSVNTSPEIYLTDTAISFVLSHIDTIAATSDTMQRVDMKLGGNSHLSRPYKREQATGYLNYYLGHCPQGVTNVNGYYRIVYPDAYPGVTLQCYSNSMGAKFYFVLKPGAKSENIILKFDGANAVNIDGNGNLIIHTSLGNIEFEHAQCYKVNPAGNVVPMPNQGDYVQLSPTEIGFNLQQPPGNTMPVVIMIDKGHSVFSTTQNGNMDWSTYFGDTGDDEGLDITTSPTSGSVFITGRTSSINFPVLLGIFPLSAYDNLFIAKFDKNAVQRWTTYYGGNGNDRGYGIVCSQQWVYVTGETTSTNLPHRYPGGSAYIDSTYGGVSDAFILRIDTTNAINQSSCDWATYFGGCKDDDANAIDATRNGNVYIVGNTWEGSCGSNNLFPLANPGGGAYYDSTYGGGGTNYRDGFIAKFVNGNVLTWSTLFGGEGNEEVSDIILNQNNYEIYITGHTESIGSVLSPPCLAFNDTTFPLCNPGSNAYFQTFKGTRISFIARFSLNANLLWSSFFGNSESGKATGVAVNSTGDVYMVGNVCVDDVTDSIGMISDTVCAVPTNGGFPICNPWQMYSQSQCGAANDIYISRFNSTNQLTWSTFYGGHTDENDLISYKESPKIITDEYNNIYITGIIKRGNNDFPVLAYTNFYNQDTIGGIPNASATAAFLLWFDPYNQLKWATLCGGNDTNGSCFDKASALAIHQNSLYLTGTSASFTFPYACPVPVSGTPFCDPSYAGSKDAFITRFDLLGYQVGINENAPYTDAFLVYPNPATDQITLQFNTGSIKSLKIGIYNEMGQQVYKSSFTNTQTVFTKNFNIHNYPAGMYLIIIQSGKSVSACRFIKL